MTIIIVYLLLSSIASSSIRVVEIGSSALVGSSIKSTSGSTASARAMQRRCCCPPERPSADFLSLSFTSSQIAAFLRDVSTISSSFAFERIPCVRGPYAMLSYMLIGNGFGFWNTIPICLRSSFTSVAGAKISFPRYLTLPVIRTSGTRSFILLSVFKKVDLPHPEGPISAVMLPSGTEMLISLSA